MKKIMFGVMAAVMLSACSSKKEETKPIKKEITATVFATGQLEAEDTYNVLAEADGVLTSVLIDEGDVIGNGKLIATIQNTEADAQVATATELDAVALKNASANAPLLQQYEIAMQNALIQLQHEEANLARYERLWAANSIAKIEVDNASHAVAIAKKNYASAQQNVQKVRNDVQQNTVSTAASKRLQSVIAAKKNVIALVGGKVYKKWKEKGDYVRRGEAIATVGNSNNIYALINVEEGSIGKLKLNQAAQVVLNTNKEKAYNAVISEILPQFDEQNKSYQVKLRFAEPLDFTIIKTQLEVNIITGEAKTVLMIPRKFIDYNNTVQLKDKKERTKVVAGIVSSDWVEVKSGLTDTSVLIFDPRK